MTTMTAAEQAIHDVLVDYDKARKSEGYAVAYRRWSSYSNISAGQDGIRFGRHVETMYLNPNGKSFLVKVLPDGAVSAFEAVA
jgi:hypothetical protein